MGDRSRNRSIIDYLFSLLSDNGELRDIRDVEKELEDAPKPKLVDVALQVKRFIDMIPGGFLIYHADKEERILYANKALLDIYGCSTMPEFMELTGGSFSGMVYPNDRSAVETSIAEQIKQSDDNMDYVEYRIVRKDGKICWVEDYGHYVQNASLGSIFYVFITDATDKIVKRMSEKAELLHVKSEKEKEIRTLIEEYDKERMLIRQEHLQRLEVIEGLSINYDSILYVDLDRDKVLPYRLSMRLERQFERKFQERDYSEVAEDYVKVWVHPDDKDRVEKLTSPDYIREKLAENPTYYLNYRCIYKTEIQYIQLRLVNVSSTDHISQIVFGYRNVDEEVLQEMRQKKLLEEALNSAKQADKAKNVFLSNMSHDMRTPLNAIFGYLALARKSISDSVIISEYLNKIENSAREILDLVEKVLDLSYTVSKKGEVSSVDINIKELLTDLKKSFVSQAERKNVKIKIDTSGVVHHNVCTDEEKIKQILSHIIGNAIKYNREGGKVNVVVTEFDSSDEFSNYKFAVSDNGIGISPEFMQRIFDPFERENTTTMSGVYGSGLGLTLAKHMIDTMGGNITVESEPEKGSTFIVTLGLRKKIATPAEQQSPALDLHGKKILLVDDNEINLEIETEMLEDLGLTVDIAQNGKIAVDKVKASKPHEYFFILMDIQMPVMDGRQATVEIRNLEDKELAATPIIALSANAFESDKRISIEAGMNAHLTKPLDIPQFLKSLDQIL